MIVQQRRDAHVRINDHIAHGRVVYEYIVWCKVPAY
jgi:hypothetical protein